MHPHFLEWLNLVIRWLHVVAGIAWIGSSFYFMWLDSQIQRSPSSKKGVAGELWMVHGGGFYQVEKFQVAPEALPRTLHWFKWEAYFTWISGFFLLGIIYYLGAKVYLIDPKVADLTVSQSIGIGIGTLVVGWLLYDFLSLSPLGKKPFAFASVSFVLLVGVTFGLSQVFSGRGAYIHVGSLLGTLMAGNVWRRIIPAQRELVAATKAKQSPDARLAKKAKQRSVHNNTMTLPVVFVMISSHFPTTYGHAFNWLILAGLFLVGAWVRHFFNLRNEGKKCFWIWPASALGMVALALVSAPRFQTSPDGERISFEEVHQVIQEHCVRCHSAHPTDPLFPVAPGGIQFDTAEQIRALADRIHARAVESKTMPLVNSTQMTDGEREILSRWVKDGAKIE